MLKKLWEYLFGKKRTHLEKSKEINNKILSEAKARKVVICPVSRYESDEEYSEGMAETKEGSNIYFGTRLADTTKEMLTTGIGVLCYPCDSFTIIDKDIFKKHGIDTSEFFVGGLENGDIINCYSCPHCSKEGYRFQPTPEEQKVAQFVDSKIDKQLEV